MMNYTHKIQVAQMLHRVLRSSNFSEKENNIELSEEKAEDILSFCSVGLLNLFMEQLIREEDYERCVLIRELIAEKKGLSYNEAWETC